MQITSTPREPYNLKMKDIDPGGFLPQMLDTNFTKFQTYKFYQLFIPCIRTPFPPSLASMLSKKIAEQKVQRMEYLVWICSAAFYWTMWDDGLWHGMADFCTTQLDEFYLSLSQRDKQLSSNGLWTPIHYWWASQGHNPRGRQQLC